MIFLPFLSLYSNPEAAGERKPVHYTPREREKGRGGRESPRSDCPKDWTHTGKKKDGKGREAPNLWLFHHKTQCKVMRKLKINAFSYPPPNLGTLVEQYKEPAENKKTRSWQTFPVLREAHFSLLSSSPLVETERGESLRREREREKKKIPLIFICLPS